MVKQVKLSTHLRQNDRLTSLKHKIDQTNGAILSTYRNIARLKQELSIHTRYKDNIYRNKVEWENKLTRIISDIAKERKIEKDLNNKYERLIDEYKILSTNLTKLDTTNRNLNKITRSGDVELYKKVEENIAAGNRHYNDIEEQNKTMYNTIIDLKNDLTTHDKKTVNQNMNKSEYITIHTGLFYLYYILAIIIVYFIYVKKYIINKYGFVFVFVLIILYPYYILNVEKYIYSTFAFLWALIKGVPYTNE